PHALTISDTFTAKPFWGAAIIVGSLLFCCFKDASTFRLKNKGGRGRHCQSRGVVMPVAVKNPQLHARRFARRSNDEAPHFAPIRSAGWDGAVRYRKSRRLGAGCGPGPKIPGCRMPGC